MFFHLRGLKGQGELREEILGSDLYSVLCGYKNPRASYSPFPRAHTAEVITLEVEWDPGISPQATGDRKLGERPYFGNNKFPASSPLCGDLLGNPICICTKPSVLSAFYRPL